MLGSNLTLPDWPSNSRMKVSLNSSSQPALTFLVWYLFLMKLMERLTYSSSLGLTKSTNALPLTIWHWRCLLLGSNYFTLLALVGWLVLPAPGKLSDWDTSAPRVAKGFPELWFVARLLGIWILSSMCPRTPSLFIFSIIYPLSILARLGSLLKAVLRCSTSFILWTWSWMSVLAYSYWAPERLGFCYFSIFNYLFKFSKNLFLLFN